MNKLLDRKLRERAEEKIGEALGEVETSVQLYRQQQELVDALKGEYEGERRANVLRHYADKIDEVRQVIESLKPSIDMKKKMAKMRILETLDGKKC